MIAYDIYRPIYYIERDIFTRPAFLNIEEFYSNTEKNQQKKTNYKTCKQKIELIKMLLARIIVIHCSFYNALIKGVLELDLQF